MNKNKGLSRRDFMHTAAGLAAAQFLSVGAPALASVAHAASAARDESLAFLSLNADDAADLAAIAARIIPTTDTPGATEAGVIHFMDQAFTVEMSASLPSVLQGLKVINARLERRFAALDAAEQDGLLRNIENGEFFALVRRMTIFGFFSMSKYGGNAQHIAWGLIGFDGHHGPWQYPFGFYDAEVHGGRFDGE
jgi:hypothetical protein